MFPAPAGAAVAGQNTNGYVNEPPFVVFANFALRMTPATHSPSASSGAVCTERSFTLPSPSTLIDSLTVPFAGCCSPHAITRGFIFSTPALICGFDRSSALLGWNTSFDGLNRAQHGRAYFSSTHAT